MVEEPTEVDAYEEVPFAFVDTEDEPKRVLHDVDASIRFAPEQSSDNKRLAFSVAIRNRGDRDVTLHNPYDVLSYVLGDAEGWPIGIRGPGSRIKRRKRRPSYERHRDYLEILAVTNAQQPRDPLEEFETDEVTIAAGAEYVYSLAISQRATEYQSDEVVPISGGRYSLRLLLTLMTTGRRHRTAIVETENVSIMLVPKIPRATQGQTSQASGSPDTPRDD